MTQKIDLKEIKIKLLMVGDGNVGKTSILSRYVHSSYSQKSQASIMSNQMVSLYLNKLLVKYDLWDASGQQQYQRSRKMAYSGTNIFLLVFSINDRNSYNNAIKKWLQELKQVVPDATVIFVASKVDLRSTQSIMMNKENNQLIKKEQIFQKINKEMKYNYFQCSALQNKGIKQLFQQSAKIYIQKSKSKYEQNNSRCKLI